RALAEQMRRATTGERGQTRGEVVVVGAVVADRRARFGPRAEEQRQQAMMEHVHEALEGGVAVVALAFAGILGQMQRQRPVGPGKSEEELFQSRWNAVATGSDIRQSGGRKAAVRRLAQSQGVFRQTLRVPQAR